MGDPPDPIMAQRLVFITIDCFLLLTFVTCAFVHGWSGSCKRDNNYAEITTSSSVVISIASGYRRYGISTYTFTPGIIAMFCSWSLKSKTGDCKLAFKAALLYCTPSSPTSILSQTSSSYPHLGPPLHRLRPPPALPASATNKTTIHPTSSPRTEDADPDGGSGPKIRPRLYQLEMLEEDLKRNIIVAASVFLSFSLCPGKKGGGDEAEQFCLQTRNLSGHG